MNRGYDGASSAWSQVNHHGAHMMPQSGASGSHQQASFGMLGDRSGRMTSTHAFTGSNGSVASKQQSHAQSAAAMTITAAKLRYESARCFDCDDDIEFNPALTQEELASAFAESSLSSRSSDSSSPQQQQSIPQGVNSYAMRSGMNSAGGGNGAGHHQVNHGSMPHYSGNNGGNGGNGAHQGHHHGGRNYRKRNPIAIIDPRYQGQQWR